MARNRRRRNRKLHGEKRVARVEMLMVFAYDISDDRRRRRVAAILEETMVRVQESVFESRLAAAASERLAHRAAAELGPGDSLRVYAIGKDSQPRCRAYGGAPIAEDHDFWLL
jgi:CRISPR-associated protein Cas2